MSKQKLKAYCMIVAFAVFLYLGISHFSVITGAVNMLLGLLTPFIIGGVIAFILNNVMEGFIKNIYSPLLSKKPKAKKFIRPLAMLTTYLLVAVVFALLLLIVLPQLVTSISQLTGNVPGYIVELQRWVTQLMGTLQLNAEIWAQINTWMKQLMEIVFNFIPTLLGMVPQLYNILASVGGGVFNFAIGIFVSMYILADKEHLMSQLSRMHSAFVPEPMAGRLANAGHITVETFRNYISGQLLDALIIGTASVLCLTILRFPYAMLIGVVMGVTNVIPFFGPFIGAIPGFFIILMVDPIKALWYILFVVILQQIDGNLIVPKIIGSSIGLPPLWVLFAVTVGGGLMGVFGMMVGMPTFAVLYRLLGEETHRRETLAKCVGEEDL